MSSASVTPAGGAPVAATWTQVDDSGTASLKPGQPLSAGKARLHLDFDAPFATGQKGFYKTAEAGTPYAFTQFEATAARMAFPCFDEPGFKIPFTTTLVVPAEMTAVANTHEISRSNEGASVRVSFAQTPAAAELPGRVRRRAPRHHPGHGRSAERGALDAAFDPRRHPARQGKGDRLRHRAHGGDPRHPREVHRHRLPLRQARHPRRARKGRRDGERGGHHVRRAPRADGREDGPCRAEARLRLGRDGARARAPVDGRPRDDEVVGRHVAERGLRHVARQQGRRPVEPGRPRADVPPERYPGRDVRGLARERARRPAADRVGERRRERVRLHHVREGRGRAPHVRAVGRPRCLAEGPARVPRGAPLRERHGRRLSRGRGRGDRQGREERLPHVPRAARRALRRGEHVVCWAGEPADGEVAGRGGGPEAVTLPAARVERTRAAPGSCPSASAPGSRVPRVHASDGGHGERAIAPEEVPSVGLPERGRERLLPLRPLPG